MAKVDEALACLMEAAEEKGVYPTERDARWLMLVAGGNSPDSAARRVGFADVHGATSRLMKQYSTFLRSYIDSQDVSYLLIRNAAVEALRAETADGDIDHKIRLQGADRLMKLSGLGAEKIEATLDVTGNLKAAIAAAKAAQAEEKQLGK